MVKGTYVDKNGVRKGAWTEEEDNKLRAYVERFGHWNWRLLPKFAGLDRCGKGCRLRWMNHLKPGINRGDYTQQERDLIAKLHHQHGNKWSVIAAELPGRTDHGIKNYWNARHKHRQMITSNSDVDITKLMRSGSSSSQVGVFVLESPDSDSSTVLPTSCSNMSSSITIASTSTSTSTQDVDDSFWTQPFLVDTDSYFRECDGDGDGQRAVFSTLFDTWLDDANHFHLPF